MYKELVVKENLNGIRLDKFLKISLKISLRRARQLINEENVIVNSKIKPPRYKVSSYDKILVKDFFDKAFDKDEGEGLKFLSFNNRFFAVDKPPFLHTAIGKNDFCLEKLLRKSLKGDFFLLNRLDYLTGGIVVGCMEDKYVKLYKKFQDEGKVKKYYVALVKGELNREVVIRNKIDHDDRKKVKVLNKEDEPLRFTWIKPLFYFNYLNKSLVLIKILKGRRHQIRAHLSFLGYPIEGDSVYGDFVEEKFLFLHHIRIEFPGFVAESFPSWGKYGLKLDTQLFSL